MAYPIRPKLRDKIIGQRFGRLIVLKYVGQWKKTKTYPCGRSSFLCKCDCGKEKIITGSHLTKNKLATKSCGCLVPEMARKYSSKPYGVSSFNFLFTSYIAQARVRNHIFEFDKDSFRKITSSDCHYCGKKPLQFLKRYKKKGNVNGNYLYNGIDRKDNNLGYTKDNSVPCCWRCNNLKKAHGYQHFLLAIKEIYEHQISKGGFQP